MNRTARFTLFIAVVSVAAPSLGCVYSVKGRVLADGRAIRFRVANAPCPAAVAGLAVLGPAPMAYAPPPVAYAQAPVEYAPPPVMMAPQLVVPPPPVVVPPVVVAPAAPPPRPERMPFLALKYAPGASAPVALSNGVETGGVGFAHSVGLELRVARWLAVRSDYEMRPEGRSWDMVGLKLSPFSRWVLRPYASVSLSGSEAYALPGKFQLGMVGAAGLDLFFGRHFFLEAEARYRVSPSDCCREVPHLTGLLGAGVAFF
jgi:hypothetical protein